MRLLSFTFLLLASTALARELPVRSVTLSSSGLAQIERAGEVGPEDTVTFRAPLADVDDLLRSLMVVDPGGTVEGLRLPGHDLATEAFRGLPLRPDDFQSRAALFSALRGQEAEAGGTRGRIADATDSDQGLRLTLITERGLRTILLREGDEVTLTDATLASRVARAAEALAAARSADERRIEITLRGTAARPVAVFYVAGAPLWKPSYRLVVPPFGATDAQARLQGWAVVENGSGSDWDRVRLALVSGEAAAFRQAIFTPIIVPRPNLPVRAGGNVVVRPDTGGRPPPPPPMPAPATMAMPSPAPGAGAPQMRGRANESFAAGVVDTAPVAQATQAESSAGRVSFVLAEPVTIRSGETANVPFLDARLAAERVWWVQDLSARNPLQAVRIRNATPHALPDGLVTVYGADGAEAGVFLGDAELRAMPAGEGRILAFARDRDVQYTASNSSTDRPTGVAVRRGFVSLLLTRVEQVALAIDPRGARGMMVVDLPRRPGATPQFRVVSEGDFGLRHEIPLNGTEQTVRLAFERAMRTDIPLWDQGLGDPVRLRREQVNLEDQARRLPGGPGTVERLEDILGRVPANAQGRQDLVGIIAAMRELRGLLDTARLRSQAAATAEQALARARQAVEDRSGAELQEARRRLNQASRDAETAGGAADVAWEAWQRAVIALLQRGA